MAAESQKKGAKAPAAQAPSKEKKPKEKKVKEAAPVEEPKAVAKPPAEPRPPADPRLKVLKKFHGRFLPRGPLRDRLKVLMERWDSGEDHGGVTFEELKALLNDWRASRTKPSKAAKV